MSMKIYEAWRLKPEADLWKFIDHVRKTSRPLIKVELKKLLDDMIEAYNKAPPEEQKARRESFKVHHDRPEITYFDLQWYLTKNYKEAKVSSFRDYFDLDVELAIRHHEGRIYLIPHINGMLRNVLAFLNEPNEWVEDFSYWDNTDQPEEVSEEDWATRGEIWDRMDDRDTWHNVLSFFVMDLGWTFGNVFWEIIQESRKAVTNETVQ